MAKGESAAMTVDLRKWIEWKLRHLIEYKFMVL